MGLFSSISQSSLVCFWTQVFKTCHFSRIFALTKVRFKLPMKHWEVAQLVGITPEHLCRLQRQMEQEGLLQRENGWLIISGLDRLYRYEEF
jgi:CRP-like cAMP-binding protein